MADLDTAPKRDYLLKGVLAPGEMSIWVGPPKCGKSFLLMFVAYKLALGTLSKNDTSTRQLIQFKLDALGG